MVDQIRTLLINPKNVPGYKHVRDDPSNAVLSRLGVSGDGSDADCQRIDALLPFAYADDLSGLREQFDGRSTPTVRRSIYAIRESDLSPDGLYERVLSRERRSTVAPLFSADGEEDRAMLVRMRDAAYSMDSAYAIGAVLLACAYRRNILQRGVQAA